MSDSMPEQQLIPPRHPRAWRLAALLVVGAVVVGITVVANFWGGYLDRLGESIATAPDRVGRNAPFIKTPDMVVDQMIELSDLKPGDLAYDLGCGDGRIIITAAVKTGCRGVGLDIDPKRVAEARENARLHGVEDLVEIREQDVFTADLREAKVVFVYLLPWMNKKLIPQYQQMQPGSRIISHDFALGDITDIKPEKTVAVPVNDETGEHLVHRWILPLKVPAKQDR